MAFEPNPGGFRVPPPTATSIGRFMPYMRGMVAGGFLVGIVIYAATQVLPNGWRPGDVAGKTAGGTLNHEIRESMDAVVERDRRVADAQAQAHAKAQVDAMVAQATINQRVESTSGLGLFATLSDLACLGSRIVEANTQPSLGPDWRRPNPNGDWHGTAQTVRQASCGLGDAVRDIATASVVDAARTASASRGMSMTDGSVRVATPVQPAPAQPRPVSVK